MLKRIFRPDHVKNVDRMVKNEQSRLNATPSKDRSGIFRAAYGPVALAAWYDAVLTFTDEINSEGEEQVKWFARRLAEAEALLDEYSEIRMEYDPQNPDCVRFLVLRCLSTYLATDVVSMGVWLSYRQEWEVYEQVLARHGLSPRTAQ